MPEELDPRLEQLNCIEERLAEAPEDPSALASLGELHRSAFALALAHREDEHSAWIQGQIADVLAREQRSNIDKAMSTYDRAIELLDGPISKRLRMELEDHAVIALVNAHHFADAERRFELALSWAIASDQNPARLWIDLAELRHSQFAWDDALAALELAREDLSDADVDKRDELLAMCDDAEGDLLLELGVLDRARVAYESYEAWAQAKNEPFEKTLSRVNLAQLALAQEDLPRIEELASDFPGEDPSQRWTLRSILARAEVEAEREDASRPRRALEILLQLEKDSQVTAEYRIANEIVLAGVLERANRIDEARGLVLKLRRQLDERSGELGPSAFADESAQLASTEVTLALEHDVRDQELGQIATRLTQSFGQLLEAWKQAPARPGGVGFLQFGASRRAVLCDLIRVTLELDPSPGGAEQALRVLESALAMGTLARILPGETSAEPCFHASFVRRDRGVLFVLPGPDFSYVFAVDADGVHAERIASRDRLEEARLDWMGYLPRAGGPPVDEREALASGTRLASLLLSDALQRRVGSWTEMAIVGPDLLGYVPFELLPLADGRALGGRAEVSYWPSCVVAQKLARRRSALASASVDDALDLRDLSAPEPSAAARTRWPDLQEIPWRDEDANLLRSLYGSRLALATGRDATASTLRGGDARVLQILTHGVEDDEREHSAGIVVSVERGHDEALGVLFADDLESICASAQPPHAPELVVLFACKAATKSLRRGDDGGSGLVGAFLRMGAACVVLSPTDLDFRAAVKLSDRFHEHLVRDGASPARALFLARGDLAKDARETGEPPPPLVHVVGWASDPVFVSAGARSGGVLARPTRTAEIAIAVAVLATWLAWRMRRRARA